MNIVLDEAFEEKQGGEKVAIGMVVCYFGHHGLTTTIGTPEKLI